MPTISTGKVLLSLTGLWSGAGSYLFDWNDTHIYNPTRPRTPSSTTPRP